MRIKPLGLLLILLCWQLSLLPVASHAQNMVSTDAHQEHSMQSNDHSSSHQNHKVEPVNKSSQSEQSCCDELFEHTCLETCGQETCSNINHLWLAGDFPEESLKLTHHKPEGAILFQLELSITPNIQPPIFA